MVKIGKKFFFKTIMSATLMIVCTSLKSVGQNAENLFQEHYSWGILTQYNIFEEAQVSSTKNKNLKYEIPESKLFALGLAYNFYQKNNWNISAEIQLQWFAIKERNVILEPENESPYDIDLQSQTEHDKIGYLPITAEYVFYRTGSFSFVVGGGLGLTYYWHYDISGSSGLSLNDVVLFEAFEKEEYQLFYLSNHIQASIYFRRKKFMLKGSVIYKKSYTPFKEGNYEFKNLEISDNIQGDFTQSGDFLGFSMIVFPKRFNKK